MRSKSKIIVSLKLFLCLAIIVSLTNEQLPTSPPLKCDNLQKQTISNHQILTVQYPNPNDANQDSFLISGDTAGGVYFFNLNVIFPLNQNASTSQMGYQMVEVSHKTAVTAVHYYGPPRMMLSGDTIGDVYYYYSAYPQPGSFPVVTFLGNITNPGYGAVTKMDSVILLGGASASDFLLAIGWKQGNVNIHKFTYADSAPSTKAVRVSYLNITTTVEITALNFWNKYPSLFVVVGLSTGYIQVYNIPDLKIVVEYKAHTTSVTSFIFLQGAILSADSAGKAHFQTINFVDNVNNIVQNNTSGNDIVLNALLRPLQMWLIPNCSQFPQFYKNPIIMFATADLIEFRFLTTDISGNNLSEPLVHVRVPAEISSTAVLLDYNKHSYFPYIAAVTGTKQVVFWDIISSGVDQNVTKNLNCYIGCPEQQVWNNFEYTCQPCINGCLSCKDAFTCSICTTDNIQLPTYMGGSVNGGLCYPTLPPGDMTFKEVVISNGTYYYQDYSKQYVYRQAQYTGSCKKNQHEFDTLDNKCQSCALGCSVCWGSDFTACYDCIGGTYVSPVKCCPVATQYSSDTKECSQVNVLYKNDNIVNRIMGSNMSTGASIAVAIAILLFLLILFILIVYYIRRLIIARNTPLKETQVTNVKIPAISTQNLYREDCNISEQDK